MIKTQNQPKYYPRNKTAVGLVYIFAPKLRV